MSKDTPVLGGGNATHASAGTSQTTATQISGDEVIVTTVPTSGAGNIIPLGNAGDTGWMSNGHATNSLKVYPPVGGTINGYSVNSPVVLPPNGALIYRVVAPLTIIAVFS